MPPLPPENSGCKAQVVPGSSAVTQQTLFQGQPEGLVIVFAHFCVARHSFSHAKPHSLRFELRKKQSPAGARIILRPLLTSEPQTRERERVVNIGVVNDHGQIERESIDIVADQWRLQPQTRVQIGRYRNVR